MSKMLYLEGEPRAACSFQTGRVNADCS